MTDRAWASSMSLIVLASTGVVAQTEDQPIPTIEEIVVTAQKREQLLTEVPMSVTALTQEELEQAGIRTLDDVAYAVPSLSVLEQGPGKSVYTIRGFGNIAGSSPLVGIYLDEASVSATRYPQLDLRIFDIERVEVLRGPQGTIYGEGSVGGTVRVITRDPDFEGVSGLAEALFSWTDGGDASQEVRALINLPLVDQQFGVRIAATYENAGGWVDIPAESRNDINGHELFNVRLKALWQPMDALQIRGSVIVHRNDVDASPTGTDEDHNLTLVVPGLDMFEADDYELYNLTATYDFGSFTFLSTSTYVNRDKEFVSNQFVPLGVFLPLQFGIVINNTLDTSWFNQEFRLSSNDDTGFTWDIGAYYRDFEAEGTSLQTLDLGGFIIGAFPGDSTEESEAWAVFANASYPLTDRLRVGAGLRYFEDKRRFGSTFVGVDDPDQEDTFDALSPRVYLSFQATERLNGYVNIAKGFRSGGFNNAGNPAYNPEDAITYEVGAKGTFLEGRLAAEVALFYSSYNDIQITSVFLTPEGAIFNILANAGKGEIKGVDWSLLWDMTDQFRFGFRGNYTDAELASLKGATFASHEVGDPLDLVPEYDIGISGMFQFDWADGVPGFARVDYYGLGESSTTNRVAGIVPPDGQSDELGILNARLHANWNNWSFELFGENLLNENGNTSSWEWIGRSTRLRPRTIGLRARVNMN